MVAARLVILINMLWQTPIGKLVIKDPAAARIAARVPQLATVV